MTLVTKVFFLFTTTARASVPMRNSMGSRPIFRAASTSLDLMARLALAMSVSPATQKRSKPAPLPMESTVMLPLYPSSANRSTIRSDSGYTVELPALMMLPLTWSGFTPGSRGSSDCLVTHSKPFFML